jgi:pyruvate dehydrogenase E2 component (dihydrolipoamide acetyltransferase)
MTELLRMPGVAADTTEAVLSSWTVPVNATFKAGEPIAVVETDKAAVDIEAERDGILLAVLADEGATVEVGTAIALLGDPGERGTDVAAALAGLGVSAVPGPAMPTNERRPALPGAARESGVRGSPPGQTERPVTRVFASPLARRLAREAGLAIEQVTGTGPNGRVTGRDIRDVIAARVDDQQAHAPAQPGSTLTPHSRLRRAIATRLTQSKQTAPHFYLRGSVRAGALLQLRSQINDSSQIRVSLNDLIVKAVGLAHLRVPEMNVIWEQEGIRSFPTADVAIAVATDLGLLTPVVRSVDTASITDIARRSSDLADRARGGALKQHELEGGTITVTNLGMYGIEEFAAIINPPQAAILAVGAVRQEAVIDNDGAVVAAPVMRLTLSVDHRPVDGVTAARWLRALIEILERPISILL